MQSTDKWIDQALHQAREKMAWVSEKNRDRIPYQTDENGNYDDKSRPSLPGKNDDDIFWWTNGFWGGLQWLLYQDTGEEKYVEVARICEEKLEKCFSLFYGLHHDVGFMYVPTAVADLKLTGHESSRRTAMHAATILAGRFNPEGRFIRAWNDDPVLDRRGWAIIDCMMNLSLLYWASEESGDPRFCEIAMAHADTVMENFIRPDGSVCHIVEFDPLTGRRVRDYGGQGYADGSSWTRGQGWAVYGFMISYLHTGKAVYLETAKRVADYVCAHIPESGLIPVDFCQPAEPAWEDSCGACVIAGGLLELANSLDKRQNHGQWGNPTCNSVEGQSSSAGKKYRQAAIKILKTITEQRADFGTDCDAIVQNCSAAYHSEDHHQTMTYADFYYIEALYKLKGIGTLLW